MDDQSMDGSMGYQQLVASDNPHDPKFRVLKGTTSVGPLTSVKPVTPIKAGDAQAAEKPEASKTTGQPPR